MTQESVDIPAGKSYAAKMSISERYKRALGVMVLIAGSTAGLACSGHSSDEVQTISQAQTPNWASGASYAPGDLVVYNSVTYRCIQGHVAQIGWEPAGLPALWEVYDEGRTIPSTPPVGSLPPHPTIENVVVDVDCRQNPENCCPEGSTPHLLTDNADVLQILTPNECIIAGHGSDTLMVSSAGPSALHLGPGDDTAMDGPGDDLIFAGDGRDTINAHGGTNLLFAGAGNDTIAAANGENTVIPGPGRDTVSFGTGDDTLYIFDECEIASGETLRGGGGENTLISPVPLSSLQAQGVTVTGFQNVVIEPHSCWSECSQKPDCSGNGSCIEGANPGEMACLCDRGWTGEACDNRVFSEGVSGIPAHVIAQIQPDNTTGLRLESQQLTPGPGVVFDASAPPVGPQPDCEGATCAASQALSLDSLTGPFRVIITDTKEADDDHPFDPFNKEDESTLKIKIDGQDTISRNVEDGYQGTFEKQVESLKETVVVHIEMIERDPFNDDLKFEREIVVDNFTGDPISGVTPNANGELCVSGGGSRVCFRFETSGRPAFCAGWKAQYLDAGIGEDYAANGKRLQSIPAAFALGKIEILQGSESVFDWNGILDADGCIPAGQRPSMEATRTMDVTGEPRTIVSELTSQFCLDGNGTKCAMGAGFQTTVGPQPEPDPSAPMDAPPTPTAPQTACVVISENPDFPASTVEPECEILKPGSLPRPGLAVVDNRTYILDHAAFNIDTRVAGVVSTILAQEFRTNDMGLSDFVSEKAGAGPADDIGIATNAGCEFDGADGKVTDSCYDPSAKKFLVWKNQEICPGPDCDPDDLSESYIKYTVAHEFGHAVQYAIGTSPLAAGSYLDKSASGNVLARCDHVLQANVVHCLQSFELSPGAQTEGFGHFFASKAFNNPEDADCTFGYYKEVVNTDCMEGAADCKKRDVHNGPCADPKNEEVCTIRTPNQNVSLPPVPVSCKSPVRWRNQHATNLTTAYLDRGRGYGGTEWDWMTFYWNLNQDVSRPWTMKEILELYDTLLPTGANTDLSFDYTVLREGARDQFGEIDPRTNSLENQGFLNGVGDDFSTP